MYSLEGYLINSEKLKTEVDVKISRIIAFGGCENRNC